MVKRIGVGIILALVFVFACGSCGSLETTDYNQTPETSKTEATTPLDNSIFRETTVSSTANATVTNTTKKATTTMPPASERDFPTLATSIFKLEMDALPKTEYKVGETLKVTTKLTNTASRGYGLTWKHYLIKVWLERVGDDPLPMITPMGLPYFSANETMVNHNINGLAGNSESYVFNKTGTYRLTVSADFDVCDFTGTKEEWEKVMSSYLDADTGKKSHTYSLSPILITVTD